MGGSRFVQTASALTIILLTMAAVLPGRPAAAQSLPDKVPPIIELEALAETVADRTQVFTAFIAEDNILKDATVYYRRSGQLPFTPAPMQPLGDTGYFSASIPTDPTDLRTIEYYLQARDEAGNRTVSGYAFDPYKRTVLPAAEPIAELPANIPRPTLENASTGSRPPLLQRRWVQVTLGILAVGALASFADDGGSNDSTVPLTINLGEP